jgi:predicted lysophospholipase L1 biosynthesis ABC-type transport system permease subunit
MTSVAEFLHQSPMGQWLYSKNQRTASTIAHRAKNLGLTLGDSIAVNVEQYSLSLKGETVKIGSLSIMSWFLDRYELDRNFRG